MAAMDGILTTAGRCLHRLRVMLQIQYPASTASRVAEAAFAGIKVVDAVGLEHFFRKLGLPLTNIELRCVLLAYAESADSALCQLRVASFLQALEDDALRPPTACGAGMAFAMTNCRAFSESSAREELTRGGDGFDGAELRQLYMHQPCPSPFANITESESPNPAQRAGVAHESPVRPFSARAGQRTSKNMGSASSALCLLHGPGSPPLSAAARQSARPYSPFALHGADRPAGSCGASHAELDSTAKPALGARHRVVAPFATWSLQLLEQDTHHSSDPGNITTRESAAAGAKPAGSRATPPREYEYVLRRDLGWVDASMERPISRRGAGKMRPTTSSGVADTVFGSDVWA